MKKTIVPGSTPIAWDAEALYIKAQRYAQRMVEVDSDEWEYALWSGFSLEFLARSALSNVSPALLADCDKSWASLYHALGFTPIDGHFLPKSITVSEAFKRLTAILPEFTKEQEAFAIAHTAKRNAELHSGEAAFEGVNASSWQPSFYRVSEILLDSVGATLVEFFGADDAKIAAQLIAAASDSSAKAVKGEVEAYRKVWDGKDKTDRKKLQTQSNVWATRHTGHRVDCPACSSQALVVGEPVAAPTQTLKNGAIIEKQEYLPSRFECIACGLKIAGLSRLTVIGLGNRYKKTQVYDASEFYAQQDEYDGYEEDNNER